MSVTAERRTGRPAGLEASTMAEAFQLTAAAHPERVALRLKDDGMTMTWKEYADRVRSLTAGLAGLGLEPGGTVGIMLTNRPEFHWFDSAALHAGATPFSIYNTYAREQIQYQVKDAEARIVVTETAFLDQVGRPRRRRAPRGGRRGRAGGLALDRRRGGGRIARLRLRVGLARRRRRRPAHADLHVGHHRAAQGRAAHAREPAVGRPRVRRRDRVPGRGPRDLVAPDGAHRRARVQPLPADGAGLHHHLLPGPAPGGGLPARGAAHLVLRGAAHLGEAQGRHRGGSGRGAGRGPQEGDRVGARRGPAQGQRRPGRRGALRRAEGGARQGGRAGALEDPRAARARRGGVGQRGRRAHAARGDRVLPRDRSAAGGALGNVRDLRVRHLQPPGPHQDRHGRPGIAGRGDQAGRRRRGAHARAR